MVKRNMKILGSVLAGLVLIGLIGLFITLGELNARYEKQGRVIDVLHTHAQMLQARVDIHKIKIERFNRMEFKNSAFASRYPVFTGILDSIYTRSNEYGFKPELVYSLAKIESDLNPNAVSYRGAYGLMQVNLGVWKNELNIDSRKIFDVDYNINTGLKILKKYSEITKGNMKKAVHLYNNGYRYNNTAYVVRVDSAVRSFSRVSGLQVGVGGSSGFGL